MTAPGPCPDAQSLRRLVVGQAQDNEAEPLEQHLLECPRCVETLRLFRDESTLLAAVRQGAVTEEVPQGPEVEQLAERLRDLAEPGTLNLATAVTVAAPAGGVPGGELEATASLLHDCLLPAQGPGELGRLGPYRVLQVLGAGGMGVVFRAEGPQLQRAVALKVMKAGIARDPACREQFLREARATASIEHDHVIAIYQVGEDHGVPYLAMPLLQGETLQARIDREKTLPAAEVVRIGRETASGLAAAHARGLIHRDVKPGNIWLETHPSPLSPGGRGVGGEGALSPLSPLGGREVGGEGGRVKILDFGLARSVQESVQLTRAGYILGTPSYMAPEQAQSQSAVDHRGDLYSLGVVLYRLCAGRLPFMHEDLINLLAAVAVEAPRPLRELQPDVPADLADLVMRLLAKKPEDRPASAAEVVEALGAIEQGRRLAQPSTPSRRPRRRWLPWAAALLLGAVGLFGGAMVYRIATDKGELIIETRDPDVKVVVKQNGREVEIIDLRTKKQIRLRSGEYEIELAGAPEKLRLNTDHFVLTRSGKQIVSVTRVPPGEGVADKTPKVTQKVGEDTPLWSPAWPSRRTASERSRGAGTGRCGCGTWPPERS